jgi:hypothetical protein
MPVFQVEQYELHVMRYRVEAATEAKAIVKLFQGEAEPVDGSLELVEVGEDFGMPADDNREIVDGLRGFGVRVGEVIPSIRSIVRVE